MRYVSPTPANNVDVINLQDELDRRLREQQARDSGIDAVREELFSQCFDELIRQITIKCAERGFLLVRVRDEIRGTIMAYQTLYESSIAYGMRKALMSEVRKNEMVTLIKQLEDTVEDLTTETKNLEQGSEDIVRKDQEDQVRDAKSFADKTS